MDRNGRKESAVPGKRRTRGRGDAETRRKPGRGEEGINTAVIPGRAKAMTRNPASKSNQSLNAESRGEGLEN